MKNNNILKIGRVVFACIVFSSVHQHAYSETLDIGPNEGCAASFAGNGSGSRKIQLTSFPYPNKSEFRKHINDNIKVLDVVFNLPKARQPNFHFFDDASSHNALAIPSRTPSGRGTIAFGENMFRKMVEMRPVDYSRVDNDGFVAINVNSGPIRAILAH